MNTLTAYWLRQEVREPYMGFDGVERFLGYSYRILFFDGDDYVVCRTSEAGSPELELNESSSFG